MAEFKFPCPHCKQHIQCDTVYVGTSINCPACQQTIMVPPVPPSVAPSAPASAAATGEGAFQIRFSTLRKTGLIALAILLVAGLVALTFHLIAGSRTLTFKAYVDGADILKLRGNQLWLEHQIWQQPTKISIDGKKWEPVWSETSSPSFPAWNNNTSSHYVMSHAFRPGNPKNIKIAVKSARGSVSIIERPNVRNQGTLAIKIDDGPQGGADWYEFTVSW